MQRAPIIPIFQHVDLRFGVTDAEAVVRKLQEERRWKDAAAIQTLVGQQDILRGLLAQAQTQACRFSAEAFDFSLSADAIGCIREMLERNFVPDAAFIDDAVMNAVVQRNLMARLVEHLLATIEKLAPSAQDIAGFDLADVKADTRAKLLEYGFRYVEQAPRPSEVVEENPQAAREVQAQVPSDAALAGTDHGR